MPSPSDNVISLESGLPSNERRKQLLMILQGFFDDSGSSANQPVFVLAGFLAPHRAWEMFSDEWAAKLCERGLDYFKMSEAQALRGQFQRGWSGGDRDQFVLELSQLVTKFAKYRVDVSVLRSDYDDIIKGATTLSQFQDPYYLLFQGVCRSVFEFQERTEIKEPCDFIFDEQGEVGARAVAWWEHSKSCYHEKVRHLIGSPPIFRDDKNFRPIQAADMYAWLMRDFYTKGGDVARQPEEYLKDILSMRGAQIQLSRDHLLSFRAALAINNIEFGYVPR